jgi:hypothetical protein
VVVVVAPRQGQDTVALRVLRPQRLEPCAITHPGLHPAPASSSLETMLASGVSRSALSDPVRNPLDLVRPQHSWSAVNGIVELRRTREVDDAIDDLLANMNQARHICELWPRVVVVSPHKPV